MAGLASVALVLSFWTEGLSMDAKMETEQGFKVQERVKVQGGENEKA